MSRPQLPELTHLQFLVLGVLRNSDQPGRALRDALAGYGIRRTGPAFYQLMARLEKDRLVDGRYEQITVGDQAVTERHYRITPDGKKRWNEARAFYEHVARAATKLRWSDA
ncbi:MAG TPA: helix-turn-helix transcriptional regulator [Vicinamibacterales bacterium]|nr:helix-turn-helix transcriptional regulator [Vicinamibacterales bacterium]